jgi:hypothetical protein
MNFKTSFSKYGLGEVILAALGVLFLYSVAKEIIYREWEDFSLNIIGVMILFVSLGALLIMRPLAILDFARKKIGLETKKNS